eukprot:scaffold297083_cov33-Prasinocladus_malaysianus.AAC.1
MSLLVRTQSLPLLSIAFWVTLDPKVARSTGDIRINSKDSQVSEAVSTNMMRFLNPLVAFCWLPMGH